MEGAHEAPSASDEDAVHDGPSSRSGRAHGGREPARDDDIYDNEGMGWEVVETPRVQHDSSADEHKLSAAGSDGDGDAGSASDGSGSVRYSGTSPGGASGAAGDAKSTGSNESRDDWRNADTHDAAPLSQRLPSDEYRGHAGRLSGAGGDAKAAEHGAGGDGKAADYGAGVRPPRRRPPPLAPSLSTRTGGRAHRLSQEETAAEPSGGEVVSDPGLAGSVGKQSSAEDPRLLQPQQNLLRAATLYYKQHSGLLKALGDGDEALETLKKVDNGGHTVEVHEPLREVLKRRMQDLPRGRSSSLTQQQHEATGGWRAFVTRNRYWNALRRFVRLVVVIIGVILIASVHDRSSIMALTEANQSLFVSVLLQVNGGVSRLLSAGRAAAVASQLDFASGRIELNTDVSDQYFVHTLDAYDAVTAFRVQFANYSTLESAFIADYQRQEASGGRVAASSSVVLMHSSGVSYTEYMAGSDGSRLQAISAPDSTYQATFAALFGMEHDGMAPNWAEDPTTTQSRVSRFGGSIYDSESFHVVHAVPILQPGATNADVPDDGTLPDDLLGLSVVVQDATKLDDFLLDEVASLPLSDATLAVFDEHGKVVASAFRDSSAVHDELMSRFQAEVVDAGSIPLDEWGTFANSDSLFTAARIGSSSEQRGLGLTVVLMTPAASLRQDRTVTWIISLAVCVCFGLVFSFMQVFFTLATIITETLHACGCITLGGLSRTTQARRLESVKRVASEHSLRSSGSVRMDEDKVDGVYQEALWSLLGALIASVFVYVVWTWGQGEEAGRTVRDLALQMGSTAVSTVDGFLVPPTIATLVAARGLKRGLPQALDDDADVIAREAAVTSLLVDTWTSFNDAWVGEVGVSDLTVRLDDGSIYRLANESGLNANGLVISVGDRSISEESQLMKYPVSADGVADRSRPLLDQPTSYVGVEDPAFLVAKAAAADYTAAWSESMQLDDTTSMRVSVSRRFPGNSTTGAPGGVVTSRVSLRDLSAQLRNSAFRADSLGCLLRADAEMCARRNAEAESVRIFVAEGPRLLLLASSDSVVAHEDEDGNFQRIPAIDSPSRLISGVGELMSTAAGPLVESSVFDVGFGVFRAFARLVTVETAPACIDGDTPDPTCGGLLDSEMEQSGVSGALQWAVVAILPLESFNKSVREWNAVAFLSGAGAIVVTTGLVTLFTDALLSEANKQQIEEDLHASCLWPVVKRLRQRRLRQNARKLPPTSAGLARSATKSVSLGDTAYMRFVLTDKEMGVSITVFTFDSTTTVSDVKNAAALSSALRSLEHVGVDLGEMSLGATDLAKPRNQFEEKLAEKVIAVFNSGSPLLELRPENIDLWWCGELLDDDAVIDAYLLPTTREPTEVHMELKSLSLLIGGSEDNLTAETVEKASKMIYKELTERHRIKSEQDEEFLASNTGCCCARKFREALLSHTLGASPFFENTELEPTRREVFEEARLTIHNAVKLRNPLRYWRFTLESDWRRFCMQIHSSSTYTVLYYSTLLAHLMLAFAEAPVQADPNTGVIMGLDLAFTLVHVVDMALYLSAYTHRFDAVDKDDSFDRDLRMHSIRWRAVMRVVYIGLMLTDWVVRYTTQYRTGPALFHVFQLPVSAILRPVIAVQRVSALREGARNFVETLVKARRVFLLSVSFLVIFATLSVALLKDAFSNVGLGRGFDDFRHGALTAFIFLSSGENYPEVVYGSTESEDGSSWFKVYFIVMSFVGLMVIVSLLVANFQEFYGKTHDAFLGRLQDSAQMYARAGYILAFRQLVHGTGSEPGTPQFEEEFEDFFIQHCRVDQTLFDEFFEPRRFVAAAPGPADVARRWLSKGLQGSPLPNVPPALPKVSHAAKPSSDSTGTYMDDMIIAGLSSPRTSASSPGPPPANAPAFGRNFSALDPRRSNSSMLLAEGVIDDDEAGGSEAAAGELTFQRDVKLMLKMLYNQWKTGARTTTPQLTDAVRDFHLRLVRRHNKQRAKQERDVLGFVRFVAKLSQLAPPFKFERPPRGKSEMPNASRKRRSATMAPRTPRTSAHLRSLTYSEGGERRLAERTSTRWIFLLSYVLCCCCGTRARLSLARSFALPLNWLVERLYRRRHTSWWWVGLRATKWRGWYLNCSYGYESRDGGDWSPANLIVPPNLSFRQGSRARAVQSVHIIPDPPSTVTYGRVAVMFTVVHSFASMFFGTRLDEDIDGILSFMLGCAIFDVACRLVVCGFGEFWYGEETLLRVPHQSAAARTEHRYAVYANRFDFFLMTLCAALFVTSRIRMGSWFLKDDPWHFVVVFPVLKLLSVVSTTRRMVFGLADLFTKYWSLFAILVLAMYGYAVVGVWMFGGLLTSLDPDTYDMQGANFDSFSLSMGTLFQLLGGEAWHDVLYASIDARESRLCLRSAAAVPLTLFVMLVPVNSLRPVLYFVSWILLTSVLFISLVIGIICDHFEAREQELADEREVASDERKISERDARLKRERHQRDEEVRRRESKAAAAGGARLAGQGAAESK